MSKSNDTHRTRPAGRLRRRRGSALVLAVAASLAIVPAASAAGDPVNTGSFRLKLSDAFENQLRRNEVVMKPKAFAVKEGAIDPITGDGTLTLQGELRFKHGDQKVVYKKLTAKLGPGGVLQGGRTPLFRLGGGSVTRNGFGADVSGVRAKFLKGAARKLNKRFGLDSLHRAKAGSVSVSEQPQTVEVTGGTVRVVPNPNLTDGSGTVVSKLNDHCINFTSGNKAIAPGIKDESDVSKPFYDFPITGGTIGPGGTDGVVNSAGGIEVKNRKSGSGSGVPSDCDTALATLRQTEFAYNLLDNYVSTRVVISGAAGVPTIGDHGVGIGSNLNASNAVVIANPEGHTVTISGIGVTINKGTALFLNQTFPQPPSYDPNSQFMSGDLFGTVNLSVTTR